MGNIGVGESSTAPLSVREPKRNARTGDAEQKTHRPRKHRLLARLAAGQRPVEVVGPGAGQRGDDAGGGARAGARLD